MAVWQVQEMINSAQQSISFCGHSNFGADVMKLAALLMKTQRVGKAAVLQL